MVGVIAPDVLTIINADMFSLQWKRYCLSGQFHQSAA